MILTSTTVAIAIIALELLFRPSIPHYITSNHLKGDCVQHPTKSYRAKYLIIRVIGRFSDLLFFLLLLGEDHERKGRQALLL